MSVCCHRSKWVELKLLSVSRYQRPYFLTLIGLERLKSQEKHLLSSSTSRRPICCLTSRRGARFAVKPALCLMGNALVSFGFFFTTLSAVCELSVSLDEKGYLWLNWETGDAKSSVVTSMTLFVHNVRPETFDFSGLAQGPLLSLPPRNAPRLMALLCLRLSSFVCSGSHQWRCFVGNEIDFHPECFSKRPPSDRGNPIEMATFRTLLVNVLLHVDASGSGRHPFSKCTQKQINAARNADA